jgi:hypothetical protein
MNWWKYFKAEDKMSVMNTGVGFCRWQRGNRGRAKLVYRHPQACGRVAQVCCEAGSMSKIKTHTIFKCTFVKILL